jgi:hypothetical protein
MLIADAQREVRTVFRGGFMGQLVSGVLWLASAAAATYGTPRTAIILLVVGGFFIFPATTLGLRLLGGPWKLRPENPFSMLGMQVAFVLPLSLPVVGAVAWHHLDWFYPAFMVVLGAHYLPFVFLYGMPMFWVLSFGLVGAGVALAHRADGSFAGPAWITGGILLAFAVLGLLLIRREEAARR